MSTECPWLLGCACGQGDFVRDLIEGLVIINLFESFMICVNVEVGTPAKPVFALFQCDKDSLVLPVDGRETFLFL